MSAPALIALAHGSRDARSARTVREIVRATKAMRPDLPIETAFLDHSSPGLATVVERLVRRGHTEMVVVPLFLTSAYHVRVDIPAKIQEAMDRHPRAVLRAADVVGTDPSLLGVLDQRMREALRSARARELDALVLAAAGSSDSQANAAVSRLAQVWGARHHLPASVAYASTSPPSTGEAVREWRRRGRRHVAVGSLFVAPGTLMDQATELALEAGAIAVSQPLGAHVELSRLILARYSVGAFELVEI